MTGRLASRQACLGTTCLKRRGAVEQCSRGEAGILASTSLRRVSKLKKWLKACSDQAVIGGTGGMVFGGGVEWVHYCIQYNFRLGFSAEEEREVTLGEQESNAKAPTARDGGVITVGGWEGVTPK